jgi:hypothetical protein
MRRIRVRPVMVLSVVISMFPASAAIAQQQPQPATAQKTAQAGVANPSKAHETRAVATHRTVHKRHRRTAARRGKKRPEYRPEYSENSVEVMNGDATNKVVFQNDQAPAPAAKKLPAGVKNEPRPMKVEVVNGTSTDTQYFYENRQNNETAQNQPVVIGIQSSDTRVAGGNQHPVVTSVTSSGIQHGKGVNSVGPPMTKQVSPRPKRPVYQPDAH